MSGRVVGEDDTIHQCRHVPQGKAMPQVERKKGVMGRKTVFEQKRFECVSIARVGNTFKDRCVIGSR